MSEKTTYDVYLYEAPNYESAMVVKGVPFEDMQAIADAWWDSNPDNDCVPFFFGDKVNLGNVNVTETTMEHILEITSAK